MVIAVFAFKKKINMPFSRIVPLFIFGILLAGGSIFIGVRTFLGVKDFTVIETVVTDKKCVEEYNPTGTKINGKKTGAAQYYYGDSYLYTGSHLEEEKE